MEPVRLWTRDRVSLEGELRMPDGGSIGSSVICHAHPRRGGSKDHPILWAVRNELAQRGFAVLSFNFRGIMRSSGSYGGGRAELQDVEAAIGSVRERSQGPTVVCGWSFGANIALREALTDERVAALVLIGLGLEPAGIDVPEIPSPAELRTFRRPVLLVAGDGDVYCPPNRLAEVTTAFPHANAEVLAGTDHFLWRREREAAALVGEFATSVASDGA